MSKLGFVAVTLLGACSIFTDFDQFATGAADAGMEAASDAVTPDADADAAPACSPNQDFSSDPKNCGACGHDCLGGACLANACQPVALTNAVSSSHVRLDATHAYFADATRGTVSRIPKRGGAEEILASDQDGLYELNVSDTYVYFQTGAHLRRVPKAGGPVEDVAAADRIGFIALDATSVYWAEGFDDVGHATLHAADLDGAHARVLADSLTRVETIALDGAELFFATQEDTGSHIWRMNLETGAKSPIVEARARRIVIDEERVYWLTYAVPELYSAPRAGGEATVVATSVAPVHDSDLALGGDDIYWAVANQPGGVYRVAKTGGAVTTLSHQDRVGGLALDDRAVYWTLESAKSVYFQAR